MYAGICAFPLVCLAPYRIGKRHHSAGDSILRFAKNIENQLLTMIRWGKPQDLATYCNEIIFSLPKHPVVDFQLERDYIVGANLLMSRTVALAGVHTALLDEIVASNLYQIENCTSHTELSCISKPCEAYRVKMT